MRTPSAKTPVQLRAKHLAWELFETYGLNEKGWKFYFNDNRSRLGVCKEYEKTIELSIFHCEQNPFDAIRNTIIHEIAHAVVGCHHMHNDVWRKKAIEMGCTGERCGFMRAPKKFVGHCLNCEREVQTNRRTNIACNTCCNRLNGGNYTADFKIIWK